MGEQEQQNKRQENQQLSISTIDLQGMLMLPQPGEVRPGYQEIRAKYFVKSKASRSQIEQIKKMAEDLSPTRDTLSSKV